MNIIEFFIANEEHGYMWNEDMCKVLERLPIDYTIDIDHIAQFHQSWEKYHHNQTWGNFAYIDDKGETQLLFPTLRVDLECFLEALKSERNNIDYELYVSFKRKYFHVKYRRIES